MDAQLRKQVIYIAVQSKFVTPQNQILAILTTAALGMTALLALLADTGHDQLWLLLAAQRMGPHLNPYGPTVFESNPPLAIWLSGLVVALAHALRLSLTFTLKLFVAAVVTVSALVCHRLLRVLYPQLKTTQWWFLAIVFVVVFGAVPARDFGQRDHILTLLILPYLVATAIELNRCTLRLSPAMRCATACGAAVGLALKPHQAIIAIGIEFALFLRATGALKRYERTAINCPDNETLQPRRPFRVLEPAIFILCAATYFAAMRILAPGYLADILPTLRDTYWAFGHLSLTQLTATALEAHILLLVVLAFDLARSRKRPESSLIPHSAFAGVLALFGYYLQGTGWYYQQLPAISLLSLALTFRLIDLLERNPLRIPRWLPIPAAALTFLAFALTIHFSGFELTPRGIEQAQPTPDTTFFAGLPSGTAVATLTTAVDDTVPAAFRYHLTLAQRYPHLWMLPAILRNESGPAPQRAIPPPRLAELDRLQHEFMVEDLNRWHPQLILVERCQDPAVHCQVLEDRHDDLLAFFMRDPAFAAIFAQYRFVRSSGAYDEYSRE